MYKIEYEIGLNEQGRPYIGLPDDYEQKPEDRFFALEVTRWMLQDLLNRKKDELDNQTSVAIDEAERLLGQFGDEVAAILYEGMTVQGELALMMAGNACHLHVESIEERDALPEKDILYGHKLFNRVEGLKVGIVPEENKLTGRPYLIAEIYELVDGITNENWKKI